MSRSNVVAFVLEALAPLQAHAFGTEGHQMVAALAEPHVTAHARRRLAGCCRLNPARPWCQFRPGPMRRERIDCGWHYVNLLRDADCNTTLHAAVPMASAWSRHRAQRKVLASSAPELERLKAGSTSCILWPMFTSPCIRGMPMTEAQQVPGSGLRARDESACGLGLCACRAVARRTVRAFHRGEHERHVAGSNHASPVGTGVLPNRGVELVLPSEPQARNQLSPVGELRTEGAAGVAVRRLATLLNANLGAVGFRHVQPIHPSRWTTPSSRPWQSRRQLPRTTSEDWSVRHGCIRPLPWPTGSLRASLDSGGGSARLQSEEASARQSRAILTNNARSETIAEKPTYRRPGPTDSVASFLPEFDEPCYETGPRTFVGIQTPDGTPWGIAGICPSGQARRRAR